MSDGADGTGEALAADEARQIAGAVSELSIAPLGREYFSRYREIREAVAGMVEAADEGPVDVDLLHEHLDDEDFEFLDAIVRGLDNFAEEGLRRQGEVEPYVSARADVDRLRPLLEQLEPHFEVELGEEDLAP